ncbi:hypothetical protein [uncultured Tenacibaculum sp.]|uniref:hypothetical protein n=1 Tax=uncultured Tenacibaculum sp. TaxID=174713 RepID=UPI00261C68A4|nr:hypothetical protein [uncultured Tenacibaculum sp.]
MENPSIAITKWTKIEKISFRFFFTYFALFVLFMNNGAYPFYGYLGQFFNVFLYNFIPWVGKTILGITYEINTGPNGSGDTTYDYVLVFVMFSLAIITTVIWSLLDRNRSNYKKLYYWLTVALRFYVGLMLINYGLVKVIKLQFPYPSYNRLNQTYGESSPMGLAWTFLGFSKGYNLFMGLAEVAAVFLLFRRTLTFGLIITLATAANVMAVNYFYDVPVKILSTHLVLMSIFLLAHNFEDLFKFFFLKKPIHLREIEKPKLKNGLRKTLLVLKVLILFYAIPYSVFVTSQQGGESSLKGFYEVKEFQVNDSIFDVTDTLKYNTVKWKNMLIDSKRWLRVEKIDERRSWYSIELDEKESKLTLRDYNDTTEVYKLTYKEIDTANFVVKGTIKSDSIRIKFDLTKDYRKKFLLTNRGFHWINERPYNR